MQNKTKMKSHIANGSNRNSPLISLCYFDAIRFHIIDQMLVDPIFNSIQFEEVIYFLTGFVGDFDFHVLYPEVVASTKIINYSFLGCDDT